MLQKLKLRLPNFGYLCSEQSGAAEEGNPSADPKEGDQDGEDDARLMHQISVLEAPVYQEYHGIYMITNRYI